MKKIALISTFCDTKEKQDILLKNIKKLKSHNIDVLCINPNFIDLPYEILKLSDYTFYTKDNPLLGWPQRAFTFWKTVLTDKGWFKMTHFLNDYGWAALYQTKKLFEIALTFDYDIFYHFIYDTEIDDNIISEIKSNKTNVIYPRRDPNDPNTLWETTLHFIIFDRELTQKIVKEITLEEYLRTNGVAEGEVLKWKNKYNIQGGENPVKDEIYLYEDTDFFNYSDNEDYKMFFNKHASDVTIWKGEPPKDVIMDSKLRILIYNIKNSGEININVNDVIKTETIEKGKNRIFEFEINSSQVKTLQIDFMGVTQNFIEKYDKLKRNYISYND